MKFNKKVLSNGLRVITVPMKDNPTVTVLVLVEAGSKYETKKINGLSHFLEHMVFKGTAKRPKAIDISRELDSLGSQYNAFTGQEFTGYYAKSEAKHFKDILDIVSDIYLNSTFPEAEMEKEKGVIIEEINMYEDMPQRHIQDLFSALLYGDQPAGWNIAGTKDVVRGAKRKDFTDYKSNHYVASATTVVVAGHINEKEAIKEIEKKFSSISKSKKHPKIKTKEKQKKPEILVKYKKTDQTHFVLGVRTYDTYDKKNATLSVIASILAGGMSSRLFQKLREEMGVGYYVRAYNDTYTDHGFLEVSAGVDNKRIKEVIKAVLVELKKLKTELVSEHELRKIKDFIVGNLNLELESSDDIANFYGGQEILRKPILKPAEVAEKIRKVTAKDIQKISKEIFQNKKLNMALIGPFKHKAEFVKVLKI